MSAFATQGGHNKVECGRMPNVMAALPNVGGRIIMIKSYT